MDWVNHGPLGTAGAPGWAGGQSQHLEHYHREWEAGWKWSVTGCPATGNGSKEPEMQIHSNDGQDQTGWLDNFLKGVDWPVGPSAAGGGQVNLGKVGGEGIQAHHSN